MSTPKEVLQNALALFGHDGENWIRNTAKSVRFVGKGKDSVMTFCAVGATDEAARRMFGKTGDGVLTQEQVTLVVKANELVQSVFCKMFNSVGEGSVPTFNDAYAKDFGDVKMAFEAAIAVADQAESIGRKSELEIEAAKKALLDFEAVEAKAMESELVSLREVRKKKMDALYLEIQKLDSKINAASNELTKKRQTLQRETDNRLASMKKIGERGLELINKS